MVDTLYQGDMDMLNQNYKELAKIIKDAKLTIKEFKEPNKPKEQIKEIDIRVLDKDRTAVFKMLRNSIESKLRVGGKRVKTVVFRDNKDFDIQANEGTYYNKVRILIKPEKGSKPVADEHETLSTYCIANAIAGSDDFSLESLKKLKNVDGVDLKRAYQKCDIGWLESSKRHGKFVAKLFNGKFKSGYVFLQRGGNGNAKWIQKLYNRFSKLKKQEGINLNNDKWNPADMWIVNKQFLQVDFGQYKTLKDLNSYLVDEFQNQNIIGISLKKCDKDEVIKNIENVFQSERAIEKVEVNFGKVVNKFSTIKFKLIKGNDTAKDMEMVIRPFTNEESSGELKGVGSLAGKVGITEINRLLKEELGKEVERKAVLVPKFKNNTTDFYDLFYKRYGTEVKTDGGESSVKDGSSLRQVIEMKLDDDVKGYYMGKFQAVSICRIFKEMKKEQQNKIMMGLYSYASSTTDFSGPFIKISN